MRIFWMGIILTLNETLHTPQRATIGHQVRTLCYNVTLIKISSLINRRQASLQLIQSTLGLWWWSSRLHCRLRTLVQFLLLTNFILRTCQSKKEWRKYKNISFASPIGKILGGKNYRDTSLVLPREGQF